MSKFDRLTITFGGRVCLHKRGCSIGIGELEKGHEIGALVTDETPTSEVTLVFTKAESVDAMISVLSDVKNSIKRREKLNLELSK